MKRIVIIATLFLNSFLANAQQGSINNLKYKLSVSATDTEKIATLDSLAMNYLFFSTRPDSAFYYINEFVNIAFRLRDKKYLILSYSRMGFYYILTSQLKASMDITLKGITLSEENNITDHLSALYYNLGWVYTSLGNTEMKMKYANMARAQLKNSRDPFFDQPVHILGQIGSTYLFNHMSDSALYYLKIVDSLADNSKELAAKDISQWYLGIYYSKMQNYVLADSNYLSCIGRCKKNNDYRILSACLLSYAGSLSDQDRVPEAIAVGRVALETNITITEKTQTAYAARFLYTCFNKIGNRDSAFYYLKLSDSLGSAVVNSDISSKIQQINFDQQLQKKEGEADRILQHEKDRRKIISYVFITGIFFLLLTSFLQWRNNKQREKANLLLQQQKEKVESTLSELKAAQSQLIQSEKMASLGELTAGIAHEIQNPLNFVNNFSEVSSELISEMVDEVAKGNYDEVKVIADNVKQNLDKINQHGKRAGDIVKGMLQHSRSSQGVKESTDINSLCDEYLRLSYHGLRAKDKTFNAIMKTDFDNSMGTINVIPQDIGRVILNLITNAFYAVEEKKKGLHLLKGGGEYEPSVSVSTKRLGFPSGDGGKIEISVADNGNGIPLKVLDKIFQPFFTTKPTGQGTGLGLSLSYDIVKAHGGELKVMTKEGEGSTFIIQLPGI